MANEPALVVKDYTAFQKSWRDMEKAEAKVQRDKMRAIGGIVQKDAANLFGPINSRSAAGFRTRVRGSGVVVAQSLKRTTGNRPDFGSLQMKRALMPAVARNQQELERQMTQMLDDIGRREGF